MPATSPIVVAPTAASTAAHRTPIADAWRTGEPYDVPEGEPHVVPEGDDGTDGRRNIATPAFVRIGDVGFATDSPPARRPDCSRWIDVPSRVNLGHRHHAL